MAEKTLFRSDGSHAALPGASTARSNPLGPGADQEVDVIVVGGGISGMSAAYELSKEGLSVLVLEAKDRLGGRTLTSTITGHKGTIACDVGGQWVSHSQPNVLALVRELGIPIYEQFNAGRNLLQLRGKKPASYSGNIPYCLDLCTSLSLLVLMSGFEYLVSCQLPSSEERFPHLFDRLSLGQVGHHYSLTSSVGETLRMLTRVVFGSEPERISFMYFLHYAQCAGSLDRLLDSSEDGAQELKLVGGTQQICNRIAERIGKDRVVCEQPVLAVSQDDKHVTVTTLHGFSYSAKRVIMATPPQHLLQMTWEPALPSWRSSALSWLPMGHLIKVIFTYQAPFWRQKGFSGSAVSSDGVLCCVLDCTFPNDDAYGLVSFIGGDDAVYWSSRSKEERKAAAMAALASMFGPEAEAYIDYLEKDWSAEPYNGGCPVAAMPPGVWTMWNGRLSDPVGKVHFAGTETASEWCGYMDGAVQAGQRAACEVHASLHSVQKPAFGSASASITAPRRGRAGAAAARTKAPRAVASGPVSLVGTCVMFAAACILARSLAASSSSAAAALC